MKKTCLMAVAVTAFASGRFFANAGTGAFLAPGDPPPRGRRWSLAQAREWVRANPWYCGFNHVPANAINDVEACHRDDPRIFMWDLYNEPTN